MDERGNTVFAENPIELDLPNVHAMVQGSIYDKYRFFLNLAAPGSGSNIDDEGMGHPRCDRPRGWRKSAATRSRRS